MQLKATNFPISNFKMALSLARTYKGSKQLRLEYNLHKKVVYDPYSGGPAVLDTVMKSATVPIVIIYILKLQCFPFNTGQTLLVSFS